VGRLGVSRFTGGNPRQFRLVKMGTYQVPGSGPVVVGLAAMDAIGFNRGPFLPF
jgi:hypothetical protein